MLRPHEVCPRGAAFVLDIVSQKNANVKTAARIIARNGDLWCYT